MKTVICSAGKGEMPAEDCIACALKHSPRTWCGYDYALIKSLIGNHEERPDVHVSDLTGCLRKAYYDKTRPVAKHVHEQLVLLIGTVAHGFLEESDEHLESEKVVAADGVVGRADVVYNDGRVVDFKTTRWIYPNKLPYGSHSMQVNIYGHLLRKMGHPVESLAIQYIDMSGPTKCRNCRRAYRSDEQGNLSCPVCGGTNKNAHLGAVLVEIPMMDPDAVETLVQTRTQELEASMAMAMPPAAEPGFLCSYCSHVDVCPEGQAEVDK